MCICCVKFCEIGYPVTHTGGSINPEGGYGVDPHPLMQWCTSEAMLMIMIAGRRKVQKDGHMQIVCHTLGNLRLMN